MRQVLFFALPFFGYEQHIAAQISKQGRTVHYVSGRIGRLADFFISFCRNQQQVYQKFIQKELQRLPLEHIDTMLVVKGVNLTPEHLEYIRSRNPKMRRVLYQWDALRNFDFRPIMPHFDRVVTFDFNDAKELGIDYQPLFFTEDMVPAPDVKEDIDILMIGTFLPERYRAMLRIREIAERNGLKIKSHIFVAPSYYIRKQLFGRNALGADNKDLRIWSISRKRLRNYYSRAKVILDVSHKDQTGMSMRVVESYAMNKKLITSNPAIEKDPYVCEMLRLSQDASEAEIVAFIAQKTPPYENRARLSIANWVKQLIN